MSSVPGGIQSLTVISLSEETIEGWFGEGFSEYLETIKVFSYINAFTKRTIEK